MLVLSRKESETILFPKLGITVEVSRVQGNTVRLGIDAPDEIRVIRGELEDTADLDVRPRIRPDTNEDSGHDSKQIAQCLNAANLAIHLAQNQLRQQLTGHAETALESALECLEELEKTVLATGFDASKTTNNSQSNFGYPKKRLQSTVHEARKGYSVRSKKVAVLVGETGSESRDFGLGHELEQLGYSLVTIENSLALIQFLRQNEQPDLVIVESGSPNSIDENRNDDCLRMFGVGSLQKSRQDFLVNQSKMTCWFSDASDETALATRLQV